MHGSRTTTIQAPCVNFVTPTITATTPVASRARPVEQGAERPARPPVPEPVAHHAGLREREGQEHPQRVERDQRVRVPLEEHQEPDRHERQDHDAVREGEPVAAVRELARDEPVPGEERGEPREVREARVGGQDEDQHRHALDQVVDQRLPEDAPRELGVHRLAFHRDDAEGVRERGDAEEQHDEDAAQRQEDAAGGLGLRGAEGGDAVGDGLDPRQGRAPGREGPEHQEGREDLPAAARQRRAPRRPSPRAPTGRRPSRSAGGRRRGTGRSAARRADLTRARHGGCRPR